MERQKLLLSHSIERLAAQSELKTKSRLELKYKERYIPRNEISTKRYGTSVRHHQRDPNGQPGSQDEIMMAKKEKQTDDN